MAFKKSIQVPQYGITLAEGYVKLGSIKVESNQVEYVLVTYASKEVRTATPGVVISRQTGHAPYDMVLATEGDELFAKMYNFIKATNVEYSEAPTV